VLRKDSFSWSSKVIASFEKLKTVLTQAPMFALPDFTKPFCLRSKSFGYRNWSSSQPNSPSIAFFYNKLNTRMQNQPAYAREFYEITEAITNFKHYLLGNMFIIQTNQ